MDTLIIGGGSIGKLFAACLATDDGPVVIKDVPLMADALQKGGVLLKVEERELRPSVQAVSSFSEVDRTRPKRVVFCTKAFDLDRALQELQQSGLTVAATLTPLNGLGIEDKVAQAFPNAEMVAGSVTFPVEAESMTTARIANPKGGIAFAPFRGDTGRDLQALVAAVEARGFEAVVCPNANDMRWSKLLLNIVANASSAILNMTAADIFADRYASMIEKQMLREFFLTAEALGIHLVGLPEYSLAKLKLIEVLSHPLVPLGVFQKLFGSRVGKARGDKRASFDLDVNVLARPQTEVDFYNGAIAAAARRVGLAAPCNQVLTEILQKIAIDPNMRPYQYDPEMLYRHIVSASG